MKRGDRWLVGRNMMIVVIAATNLLPENQYHERTITYDKRNGIR